MEPLVWFHLMSEKGKEFRAANIQQWGGFSSSHWGMLWGKQLSDRIEWDIRKRHVAASSSHTDHIHPIQAVDSFDTLVYALMEPLYWKECVHCSLGHFRWKELKVWSHFYCRNSFHLSLSYLHHTSLPADPEAAELVPGEDAWCGSTDQRLAHLTQTDPWASVLPAPQHDLKHLCAVMGAGREGEMGIVVGLHCHMELVHPGWLFHILILILVGGRNVDSLWW